MPLSPPILPLIQQHQFLMFEYFFHGITTLLLSQRTDSRTLKHKFPFSHKALHRVTFDPSTYLTRLALAGIKIGQQPKLTVCVFTAVLLKQAPFICRIYLSDVAPIYSRLFFTLSLNNRDKLRQRIGKNKSSKSVRTCKSHSNEQNNIVCNWKFQKIVLFFLDSYI